MPISAVTYRCVLIRPTDQFRCFSRALSLAGIADCALEPRLFNLPLVCVVIDPAGRPEWNASAFLANCSLRGRGATGDTARSYGEALVVWLNFLRQRMVAPQEATEETLGLFRAQIVNSRSVRGRQYSSATSNHRVTVAAQFHLWGEKLGLMSSPLGSQLHEWDRDRVRHGMSQLLRPNWSRRHPVAPRVIQRLPVVLSKEAATRLLQTTPQPFRLMFRWCLCTGLRRFEVCALRISQLPSPESIALSPDGLIRIDMTRKGGRVTTVHVPGFLIEETRWHILTERRSAAVGSEDLAFLNARGRAISRNTLSTAFRAAADRIGSSATLHHLRHTFAVHVLKALETGGSVAASTNAIKTLQVLLGHASIETTEIYLRAVEASSDGVIAALDYLYGGFVSHP